jgi:hypothetical protein
MSDDRYLELLETARDAVRDVILESECGTGVITLNYAYDHLKRSIKTLQNEDHMAAPNSAPPRARWWKSEFSVRDREHQILDVLAEHRLTLRELAEHMRELHPDLKMDHSSVISIANRLLKAGELDRQPEHYNRGPRIRYRYFRRVQLDGPIADLDRAFREEV